MTENRSAAYWRQVCFAADNWSTAERLDESGHAEIAEHYRRAAQEHARAAEKIAWPDIELRVIESGE